MDILILTAGSRGDVQPFVALGCRLQAAGHAVTLCTATLFESFVQQYGLRFAPMNDEILRLKDTAQGQAAMEGRGNKLTLMRQAMPLLRKMLEDSWAAAQRGADLIIYHPKTLSGLHLAEKLGVPAVLSLPAPLFTPTREFPMPLLPPSLRFGPLFNRFTYRLTRLISAPYAGIVSDWRQHTLGLPRRSWWSSDLVRASGQAVPVMYSFSTHVIPRPADWPAHVTATGYWFLDQTADWRPPEALQRFLEAGNPPVYVGFGSMVGRDPRAKVQAVLDALRQLGSRGIIASGWGGLQPDNLPSYVFPIQEMPHDWLLPRVAAVVHHGGAGTTAAAIRAGKPSVICPFMGEQPFWGWRTFQLGVGARPIPQKHLTAARLAEALQKVTTDEEICRRAGALAARVSAEQGVGNALRFIERVSADHDPDSYHR